MALKKRNSQLSNVHKLEKAAKEECNARFNKTFHYASDFAIGAVLTQDHGKGEQPVAYESKKLSAVEQNAPPMKKNY